MKPVRPGGSGVVAVPASLRRLAASADAAARWVGKDALRDLTRSAVIRRLRVRRIPPSGR